MFDSLDVSQWLDLEALANRAVAYFPNVVAALFLLLAVWVFVRVTRRPLRAALRRGDFAPALLDLLVDKIYTYTLIGLGVIMAAGQLGINLTAALGTLGVAGIAIGFAAQDTLSNMIAGLMIFWDKPFRVGNYVTTTDGLYGRVDEITLRTTRIRTNDNTYVVIPNADVIDDPLVNHSMHGDIRIQVPVGIAYGADIRQARDVLLEAAAAVDGVLDDPAPTVVVDELADSSVNLKLRVWIDQADRERAVAFATLEASKNALDEAGIEIPFPHLQLYLDDVEEPVWQRLSELPRLTGATEERSMAPAEA